MNKIEPAYLLLGPEVGKKAEFLDKLKTDLRQKTGDDIEEHHFWPFESQAPEIISLIKNGSLFAGFKLVRVSQAESLSAADRKTYIEYLKQPSKDAVLVFCSEENRLGRSFINFENTFTKNQKIMFWELFENEKRSWLTGYFKHNNRNIESEAVELILEMVQNNTVALRKECENIILMTGEQQTIGPDDIEEFLFHSREENVFSLFGKMVTGKFTSSLEALQKILDSGEGSSVQLTGGLLWQFQRLLDLRILIDANYSIKDAFDRLRIKGRRNQAEYQKGLARYSTTELRNIIMVIADFDSALRQVRSDMERTLLDMLIYACVQKKGNFERLYSEAGSTLNST